MLNPTLEPIFSEGSVRFGFNLEELALAKVTKKDGAIRIGAFMKHMSSKWRGTNSWAGEPMPKAVHVSDRKIYVKKRSELLGSD